MFERDDAGGAIRNGHVRRRNAGREPRSPSFFSFGGRTSHSSTTTASCSSTSTRRTSACCTRSSCALLESGSAPAQRLLLPITLHLGPAEGDAFEANREYLEKLGFEVEGFGGNTLIVNTVPMPHRALRCRALPSRDARCADGRSRGRHRDAARASCRDGRVQGGDQGGRGAVAGGDALAVRVTSRHQSCRRTTFTAGRRSCSSRGTSSTGALAGDSIRVICGPTAAGKSAIALALALEYTVHDHQRRLAADLPRLRHRDGEADGIRAESSAASWASTSLNPPNAIPRHDWAERRADGWMPRRNERSDAGDCRRNGVLHQSALRASV